MLFLTSWGNFESVVDLRSTVLIVEAISFEGLANLILPSICLSSIAFVLGLLFDFTCLEVNASVKVFKTSLLSGFAVFFGGTVFLPPLFFWVAMVNDFMIKK